MSELYDSFNRKIDYLRISVTDRCNLRCFYCMPEEGIQAKPHSEILAYEEIETFARAAVKAGIAKIRLTGGEPLVRKDILKLVAMLASIPGLDDLSMTTNALLLGEYAADLKAAGLKRLNISLDSLDPEVYQRLTRKGDVDRALAGMKKALEAGLTPVKINTVLIRGVSDDPEDFIKLIYDYPVHVRFIEFMPIGEWDAVNFISINEFRAGLGRFGKAIEVEGPAGAGPARYVSFKGAKGTFGFISPISRHFCGECNRLRLTPDGKLRVCLFSDQEFDIRPKLKQAQSEEEIVEFIKDVANSKPEKHRADENERLARLMCQIGG